MKHATLLLCIFSVAIQLLYANTTPLELTITEGSYDLKPHTEVAILNRTDLPETDNSILDKVGTEPLSSFKLFGRTEYWFVLTVSNHAFIKSWVLTLGENHDLIELYLRNNHNYELLGAAGTDHPHTSYTKLTGKLETIPFELPEGDNLCLWIRVVNRNTLAKQFFTYSLQNYNLYSREAFNRSYIYTRYINVFFYGAILAMFFYNLVLSLTVQSRGYRAYTTFLFVFFLFNFFTDGFASEWLFPAAQLYDRYLRILIAPFLIIMYLIFARIYLNTPKYIPKWDKVLMVSILLLILNYAFFAMGYWWLGRQLLLIQIGIACVTVVVCSQLVTRQHYLPAKFFLAGNLVLIVAAFIYILYLGGLIPHVPQTKFIEYVVQVASIFDLSLFSLGLASRIKVSESELLEQQRLRELEKQLIIEEKNKELEIKIEQRTDELKQQKETIEQINLELERKVRERTKKLQKAYRDLLNLNYELDSFIYRAAHDIRGPISTIMGLCNIALMEKDFHKCQEYLQILDKYSKNTQFTLNRILSVNDLKNNHIKLKHFNWNDLRNSVLALLLNNQDTSKVVLKFQFPLDEDVYSDMYLMQLIFQNMIDNSIRFRDNNSGVQPYCQVMVQKEETHYLVRFEDNGEGINDEIKEKIFDMFFRGSEYSSGSGLGLYIVKIAVKKLGGEVSLVSSQKGKTIFEVVLPIQKEKLSKTLADQVLQASSN